MQSLIRELDFSHCLQTYIKSAENNLHFVRCRYLRGTTKLTVLVSALHSLISSAEYKEASPGRSWVTQKEHGRVMVIGTKTQPEPHTRAAHTQHMCDNAVLRQQAGRVLVKVMLRTELQNRHHSVRMAGWGLDGGAVLPREQR